MNNTKINGNFSEKRKKKRKVKKTKINGNLLSKIAVYFWCG